MLLSMKNNINSKKNNLIIKGNIKNKPILNNNIIKNIKTISSESTTEVNTNRVKEKNSKNNLGRFNLDMVSSNVNNNNSDEETKINKKNIKNNQFIIQNNNKKIEKIEEHNKIIDNLLDDILEIEGKRILNNLSESIIITNDGRFIINNKKLFSSKYEDSLLNYIFNIPSFLKQKKRVSFNNNNNNHNHNNNHNNHNNNNNHSHNNNNFFSPQSTKQKTRMIYRNIYLLEQDNNFFNNNKGNYKQFSPPIINQKQLNNKNKILINESYGNNKISLTQGNISKSSINKNDLCNNNSIAKRKIISKIDDNPLPKRKKRNSHSFY